MARPATPRGAEVHKKRIASDTVEWHRRLDELVEISRSSRFYSVKSLAAPTPPLIELPLSSTPLARRSALK